MPPPAPRAGGTVPAVRRILVLVLTVAVVGPASSGCGDRCGDVDCGAGGAYVSWADGDVPTADAYRLCLDDRCHAVEPATWPDPETDVVVQAGEGRSSEPVAVRLEALDDEATVVASFTGRREATGECCEAVSLQVDGDRLVPHRS